MDDLGIVSGEPDEGYFDAYLKVYRCLARLADVSRPAGIGELRGALSFDLESASRPDSALGWTSALWEERTSFFQFTKGWLDQHVAPIIEAQAVDPRSQGETSTEALIRGALEALDLDESGFRAKASHESLFAPERWILRVILKHWQELFKYLPPSQGGYWGRYRLGKKITGGESVFEIEGEPDRLIRAQLRKDTTIVPVPEAWLRISEKQRPDGQLVRVLDVDYDDRMATLVMRKIDGMHLRAYYEENAEDWSNDKRYERAFRCAVDIADALSELRAMEVCHGDVSWKNIMWDKASDSFVLIDLEHAVTEERLGHSQKDVTAAGMPVYRRLVDKLKGIAAGPREHRIHQIHALDTAMLLQIVLEALCRRPGKLETAPIEEDLSDCPRRFDEWIRSLTARWSRPGDCEWTPRSFLVDAVRGSRDVFVSGVTAETATLKQVVWDGARSVDPWHVQGSWKDSGDATADHLYRLIRRSSVLVLLLGNEVGARVTDGPGAVQSRVEELPGWPDTEPPSHTQFELFAALEMKKKIIVLDVTNNRLEPSDPSQKAFVRFVTGKYRQTPVTEGNIVEVLRKRLADLDEQSRADRASDS